MVKKAEFEAWANRIDEALVMYEEAVAFQRKYHQDEHEEINQALAGLLEKINEQSCIILDNHLFELKQKVNNRLKNRKYDEALSFLEEALYAVEEDDSCAIDTSWIAEVYSSYDVVFGYVEDRALIRSTIQSGDYHQAVVDYLELKAYANNNNLGRFGINIPEVDEFARQEDNQALSLVAAEVCAEQGLLDQGLQCLRLLKKSGFQSRQTKKAQEILGRKLSVHDSARGIAKKEYVSTYTGNDKWYRYFRSAYLSN
jgi:hypothetical protein